MKKLGTILFLLFTLLQIAVAYTCTDKYGVTWTFTVENNEATITGASNLPTNEYHLVIPSSVTYIQSGLKSSPVVTIGEQVFKNNKTITSITFPTSVKSIGNEAFSGCSNLSSLSIPYVTTIGQMAFEKCTSLRWIELLKIASIGDRAFEYCTNLYWMLIPPSLVSTGDYVFLGCDNIKKVIIQNVFSVGPLQPRGLLYAPGSATYYVPIGSLSAFQAKWSWLKFVEQAPSSLNIQFADNAVKAICVENWDTQGDMEVSVAEAVMVEGRLNEVFKNNEQITSFNELSYFTNLKYIWDDEFQGCYALTTVNIPEGVTAIGAFAFKNCGLSRVSIPKSVNGIYYGAFEGCSHLTEIYMYGYDPSVIDVTPEAFPNAKYQTLYVPAGCKAAYEADAFWGTFKEIREMNFISFADELVRMICLKNWDTNDDGELSYEEAAAVKNLRQVFKNQSIKMFDELKYFTGLPYIDQNAFEGCRQLQSITIPESATFISEYAFSECTSLTSLTIPNSIKIIGEGAFYKSALTSISLPASVVKIGSYAFARCDSLKSVVIPNGVENIGIGAFEYTALTAVSIPASVTVLKDNVFEGCSQLTSVELPASIVEIGKSAFMNTVLTSVSLPTSMTTIGAAAFQGCALTSITIPAAVTSIGDGAFSTSTHLYSISVEAGNTVYDSRNDCNAIIRKSDRQLLYACKNTTIPQGVLSIGVNAFRNCGKISQITIPPSVSTIGNEAFYGCSFDTVIVEEETPISITSNVFSDYTAELWVPEGSREAYLAADGWKLFRVIVEGRPTPNIVFEDAEAECICVNNWDLNLDGKFSMGEAARVTSLGEAFRGKNITSFNELAYFTNLTLQEGDFNGCRSLVSITLPNSVTKIPRTAFGRCSQLTTVLIPSGVTSIDAYAFAGCTALPSITIPDGVASIGEEAFENCSSLTTLLIPSSVESIGNNAFYHCSSLSSIKVETGNPVFDSREDCNAFIETKTNKLIQGCSSTIIPNGVRSIAENAFARCTGLTSLVLPNGIAHIGDYAFDHCSGLTSISIPNSVTYIGDGVFRYCTGLTSVVMSSKVKSISFSTFEGCTSLASFDLPDALTTIGVSAFAGCCSMTSITIPLNVTTIGSAAFAGCSSLSTVTVERGTPVSINSDTFEGCPKETLYVPAGCKAAYKAAYAWQWFKSVVEMPAPSTPITFADAKVKSYCVAKWDTNFDGELSEAEAAAVTTLGDVFQSKIQITTFEELKYFTGLSAINSFAFYNCTALTSVQIPSNVTEISKYAFSGCSKLSSITIPATVTSIGNNAFASCAALLLVKIPDGVTTISADAFSRCCSLVSVDIPNSTTSIGDYAFQYCTSLTSVKIPGRVASIGHMAFYNCGLTKVTVERGTPISIEQYTFGTVSKITLYVPYGCKAAYSAADYWKDFKEIIEMPSPSPAITFADANVKAVCLAHWDTNADGELSEDEAAAVTDLGTAFEENASIVSFNELQYFTGLTAIGDNAFAVCTRLKEVVVPSGVTSIGVQAFYGCTALTSFSVRRNVRSIGLEAFRGCTSLSSLYISNTVESIGNAAFRECTSLASVTIPGSATSVDPLAFAGCTALTTLTVQETNKVYDSRNDCNAIIETASNTLITGCMNTVIPNSVTSIGVRAFVMCSTLPSITIPEGVETIGDHAFNNCSGLASVNIAMSVNSIGTGAFFRCTSLTSVTVNNPEPVAIGSGAFSNRANATLTVPYGSKAAYAAADVWKEFKEIIEIQTEGPILAGDANGDGHVDIVDVTMTISHILGQNPASFNQTAADVNKDGKVDIVDVTSIIDIILKQ